MDRDHYRSKAMECLAAAQRSREPADRIELLGIAQSFIRLSCYAASRTGAAAPPWRRSSKSDGRAIGPATASRVGGGA